MARQIITGLLVEHQQSDNLCWAAVTAGVLNSYLQTDSPRQDQVARDFLGPRYPDDVTAFLDKVLAEEACLRPPIIRIGDYHATDAGFSSIFKPELDAGRPVCAQMTFADRDHYVAIAGYDIDDAGSTQLLVQDPADPNPSAMIRSVALDEFRNSYDGEALWTYAYFTQSPRG
jgi:hypothetical protein